ncbi:6-phosphogluconolactonase [Solitalea koreensis]|uniref:6-phosphogluconolactonase n=1 Tax=Solitalea koreensis TaxID=543615 RepID=A0A521E1P4_9SPHI|nr:6-phosphogluconolactonase [Solitalea koreensis]SMO77897.1 6-phosphogluconolactonase [Solitalea koreensis]
MTADSTYHLKVFQTADELCKAAAEFFIDISRKSIAARGRFVVSLSGGTTPQGLYSLLSESPFREQVEWEKTVVFWGDERCVSLNDTQNNAHQAKITLLDKIDIPKANIYAIPVNLSPEEAAINYEKEVNCFFGKETPRFDLMLLGLGENGHTASLFPGTNVIYEQTVGIRAVYVEEEKMFRITMTAPLINQSGAILFLVNGENKAVILKEVLTAAYRPDKIPAHLIQPVNGELYWFVDRASASLITIKN